MSPSCSMDGRRLGALVDGELRPAARAKLQRHLDGCPRCRAAIDDLQGLRRGLKSADTPPPPLDPDVFRNQVLRGIEGISRARDRRVVKSPAFWAAQAAWAVPLLVLGLRAILAGAPSESGNPVATVQIELVNPGVVPIIDLREDGIPVVWLSGNGHDHAEPPPI